MNLLVSTIQNAVSLSAFLKEETLFSDCGGELTAPAGYFTSPGLLEGNTGNYSHSLFCQWNLMNAPVNSTIVFSIDMMSIEEPEVFPTGDSRCIYDFLDFRTDSDRITLGKYCGNQTGTPTIISPFEMTSITFRVRFIPLKLIDYH